MYFDSHYLSKLLQQLEILWRLKTSFWFRFYTYGDFPLERHLELVSENALSKFSRIEPHTQVPAATRWSQPVSESCLLTYKIWGGAEVTKWCLRWFWGDVGEVDWWWRGGGPISCICYVYDTCLLYYYQAAVSRVGWGWRESCEKGFLWLTGYQVDKKKVYY